MNADPGVKRYRAAGELPQLPDGIVMRPGFAKNFSVQRGHLIRTDHERVLVKADDCHGLGFG